MERCNTQSAVPSEDPIVPPMKLLMVCMVPSVQILISFVISYQQLFQIPNLRIKVTLYFYSIHHFVSTIISDS